LTDSTKDIVVLTTLVLAALTQQPTAAPAPPPAPPAPPALEVGAVAPNFSLPGATRFGTLKNPVRLSDYKGKTVVLAFFFKARTRG
jgi:peroxiredoxin Q/BCP